MAPSTRPGLVNRLWRKVRMERDSTELLATPVQQAGVLIFDSCWTTSVRGLGSPALSMLGPSRPKQPAPGHDATNNGNSGGRIAVHGLLPHRQLQAVQPFDLAAGHTSAGTTS